MVINNMMKFKHGFSLFETFVVMMIVGVFIALMANTIAHRPKAKMASEAHGRFECYYKGGQLYQQMFTEGSTQGAKLAKDDGGTATTCSFQPPYYAKYMIIDAVGGGAGGDDKGGGSEGQFVSAFYDYVATKYTISPGKGGAAKTGTTEAQNGKDTYVYDQNDNKIVTALGGKSFASLANTTVDDILSCSMSNWTTIDAFWCNIPPTCEVGNGKVTVSYCRSKGLYTTRSIGYKKTNSDGTIEMKNPRYIVNDLYTQQDPDRPNTWIYHDISVYSDYDSDSLNPVSKGWDPSDDKKIDDPYAPSLYTMEIVMNTSSQGKSATPSNLARFIESMQYSSGIKDVNVGQGGAQKAAGMPGAVIFLW